MCGRYYTRRQKQEIAQRLRAKKVFEDPFLPNFNVAPTTFQPIVRQERDSDDREMVLARWGLVPNFAKSLADFKGISTINARAETVAGAPTYRVPFRKRRCLVPFDGFYEWQKLSSAARPAKQPFAFTVVDSEPVAFAGLWDAWKDPAVVGADAWLQSFTIITTDANELMARVHNRMPVILPERDWDRWLSRDPEAPPPIDLLRPFDADLMAAAPCNPAVGNVRNNGPEMLVCPTPDTLPLNSA